MKRFILLSLPFIVSISAVLALGLNLSTASASAEQSALTQTSRVQFEDLGTGEVLLQTRGPLLPLYSPMPQPVFTIDGVDYWFATCTYEINTNGSGVVVTQHIKVTGAPQSPQ
jgi:hypothetical protein